TGQQLKDWVFKLIGPPAFTRFESDCSFDDRSSNRLSAELNISGSSTNNACPLENRFEGGVRYRRGHFLMTPAKGIQRMRSPVGETCFCPYSLKSDQSSSRTRAGSARMSIPTIFP